MVIQNSKSEEDYPVIFKPNEQVFLDAAKNGTIFSRN